VVVQEHSTRGFSDLFLIFNLTEQATLEGVYYEMKIEFDLLVNLY